ncbi:DUF3618 domain-containing protein [Streptomyces sp. SPB162]|uniref:DUF3618 domain-containing protein n=1 Tax=Streptomyces sp. SPB162 TaxID=2940560 RepID=UPI002406831B|nr:DUF3618 domain-containing protein [Streptomyces sp. SPB162]MDF9810851.1 hypothetical protein [Streptomyces sp. SPB162]
MAKPHRNESEPTPQELREQMEHTRDELGLTVEALAAKADVRTRVLERAAQAAAQVRDAASRAGRFAANRTPDAVSEKADQAALSVRANRTPLIAAAAVLGVYLLVRCGRSNRRR